MPSFYEVSTEAINDLIEHGFDSRERLDYWLKRLALAMGPSLIPESTLQRALRSTLDRTFKRATSRSKLLAVHQGVSEFTLKQIAPRLRDELDRRIVASANLIKLNREASIARTLQRFAGWATSIPAGGTEIAKRKQVKEQIRRGIAALPFEERRVIVDQNAKLTAAINDIIAVDGGAIAAEWHHVKEGPPAYDARPDHVARNGKVYLIRDAWADEKGFVKGPYSDEITQPAFEPFCRCWFEFIYTLRDVPDRMLTAKGKEALLEVRRQIRQLA